MDKLFIRSMLQQVNSQRAPSLQTVADTDLIILGHNNLYGSYWICRK